MIVVDTNIISYFYISGECSNQVEQLLIADSNWNAPSYGVVNSEMFWVSTYEKKF